MSTYRNLALFSVLAAVWGTAFMAIKAGLDPFAHAPVLFAAVRYDVAGLVMVLYAVYAVDDWLPRGRDQWLLVVIGGTLMIAGYHTFLFVGEQHTTSAAAAVIVSLSPVLTTGFARAFLPSERLRPLGVVGLLLGLVGVVVLADPNPAMLVDGTAMGEFLVFMAAVSFALGTVLTKVVEASLPIETMEAWSMVLGALLMHLISLGIGEDPATVSITPTMVLSVAYLAIAASAVGFLIYFDLLDRLGPIEINLVSYVAPVFAALSGWLFLDELLTTTTVDGFAIIVVGFWLLKREELTNELSRLRRQVLG